MRSGRLITILIIAPAAAGNHFLAVHPFLLLATSTLAGYSFGDRQALINRQCEQPQTMADLQDQLALQVSRPYESSIPTLLEQCKAEITRLELQLAKQYEIKAGLEDTFSPLRRTSSAVRRLPEEILVYIFLEVLPGNPMAIGPVLLVCRQWNRVACNAPTLWTNIVSKPRPNPASIIRATKYVQTALRNSRSLPLNVTLKLPSPTRLWWDIAERIWPNLSEKDPEYKYYQDAQMKRIDMVDWLSDINRNNDGLDGQCTRYREITNALHFHVDTFFRDEEERGVANLDRIRSLTIYFNSNEYENWVHAEKEHLYEVFTPMPEYFSIIDETTRPQARPQAENELYVLPNPNIKRLCWKTAYPPENFLHDDGNLLHLRLYWIRQEEALSGTIITNLPRGIYTKNLRQLFLHCEATEEDIGSDKANLFFPQLEDLALAGLVHKSIFEALIVPRLSKLRLFDYLSSCSLFNQASRLPMFSIDKLHVHEKLFTLDQFTIEQVSKLFPSISQLGILGETVESVEKCLRRIELRNDGVSLKGYRYSEASFWEFDSYEHNEIVIGF